MVSAGRRHPPPPLHHQRRGRRQHPTVCVLDAATNDNDNDNDPTLNVVDMATNIDNDNDSGIVDHQCDDNGQRCYHHLTASTTTITDINNMRHWPPPHWPTNATMATTPTHYHPPPLC